MKLGGDTKLGLVIVPVVGLMLLTAQLADAHHVDDRFGILISVAPQRYNFHIDETVLISGEVHALRNGSPVLLTVFNSKNSPCSFQQLSLDRDMKFEAQPIKLHGALCNVEGEYKITVYYGKGKALTKFNVAASSDELMGGEAEVINAQIVSDFLRVDNKYPVDLNWSTNAVRLKNNMNQTTTFYVIFAEFDTNEITKTLSYKEITLEPFRKDYVIAPFVPHIIDGKADGYLHIFAWTALDDPTPLHPGLYIPY